VCWGVVLLFEHDSACRSVCVWLFSCTLHSAIVLLVSIKFRFVLGYSSVWHETQRQDRVSVGRPIKKTKNKRHLVTVYGSKTSWIHLEKEGKSTTNKTACPESYLQNAKEKISVQRTVWDKSMENLQELHSALRAHGTSHIFLLSVNAPFPQFQPLTLAEQ